MARDAIRTRAHQVRAPMTGSLPSRSATAGDLGSSGREKAGDNSTTGPEKWPPATITGARRSAGAQTLSS
ncbi:hypothetical protein [Streptomyces sp. NBC_01571]|uniref:hypothetical protein n=1 Tax=unclassified Streptomyces TaxID=2593676 RepID=UPI00225AB091|nr:hypothetical protein [Streptomyces sp. NBC_01571]MCX4572511.1 hypothetical protein [Streptomyces sp. NBC_01571]